MGKKKVSPIPSQAAKPTKARKATVKTAGYSGTPLPKKLGIKPNTTLKLINAPEQFPKVLGELPEGVNVGTTIRGQAELWIWFPKNQLDLGKRIDPLAKKLRPGDGLWVAWPKKSSGVQTDLTQDEIRKLGLATGIVDYKICAIDETYSGLKFGPRRA